MRGPGFDGHSPEIQIANSWPTKGPPVLWTRELGQGYSAFVAAKEYVYTQGQSLTGQYVYCLHADTGKTIWSYKYDWPYEGMGVYPGPRSTPTLKNGRVFYAAPSGQLGCLDADTGKMIWKRSLLKEYDGTGGDGFGYSCSPVVTDGMVIMPVGGKSASLVALDEKTGKEIWSEGDDPASYAPVYPIERNGHKLVVGYLQNSLVIHDRMTGRLLKRLELSHGYDEHSCWPIYREPYLWISGPFRSGSRLYEIPENLDSKEQQVWTSRIMSNDVVSSVLVNDSIYGFDIFDVQSKTQRPSRGMFRCIDFLTGEEKWSQGTGRARRGGDKDDPEEIGQCGMIAADGKLIVFNERGELILLKQNPDKLDVLARSNILSGELSWTPPALHRGRVYLRNHSRAVCVYVGEPELLKSSQQTMSVADVPQSRYQDLAAWIIPVEPEFMFDVPSKEWMWNWYCVSLGILGVAGLIGFMTGLPFTNRRLQIQMSSYRVIAFLLGAIGTTLLSQYQQKFYFTWVVCLYVTFEPVIGMLRKRNNGSLSARERWGERLILTLFLAVCVLYFLMCKRLSLVFEWAFLSGFLGAIPFLLIKKKLPDKPLGRIVGVPVLTLFAFTGFYGAGIAVLIWGY